MEPRKAGRRESLRTIALNNQEILKPEIIRGTIEAQIRFFIGTSFYIAKYAEQRDLKINVESMVDFLKKYPLFLDLLKKYYLKRGNNLDSFFNKAKARKKFLPENAERFKKYFKVLDTNADFSETDLNVWHELCNDYLNPFAGCLDFILREIKVCSTNPLAKPYPLKEICDRLKEKGRSLPVRTFQYRRQKGIYGEGFIPHGKKFLVFPERLGAYAKHFL